MPVEVEVADIESDAVEFAISGLRMVAASKGTVMAAAWSGKIKTACTMVGLCLMMVFMNNPMVDTVVTWVIVLTTLYSGIEYFVKNKDVLAKGTM